MVPGVKIIGGVRETARATQCTRAAASIVTAGRVLMLLVVLK
jgi:hypothetical protein